VTPAEHRRQLLPTGIIERYTPSALSAVSAPRERTTAGPLHDGQNRQAKDRHHQRKTSLRGLASWRPQHEAPRQHQQPAW
jgi:hypothetical protein